MRRGKLYVSNAGANKSFNSGTIGEVSRVVQSVSASSICSAGSSLVGMMVGVQFVKKLAIIVSLPESLVWGISHGQCGFCASHRHEKTAEVARRK